MSKSSKDEKNIVNVRSSEIPFGISISLEQYLKFIRGEHKYEIYEKFSKEDLENNLFLVNTKKCKTSKDALKAMLAAYGAGVAQLWSYWSTDFANIGYKTGFVDVPWLIGHLTFTPDEWLLLAIGSSALAMGLTIYSAYKLGRAVKEHRLLKDAYDSLLKK
ncbi:MAG: hypothetical protein QXQ79_00225, partial [Candidatus Nanoarchaeia archaeon]